MGWLLWASEGRLYEDTALLCSLADPTVASTQDTKSEHRVKWNKRMEELAIKPENGGSQLHG